MSLKILTDEEIQKLMLANPTLGSRKFCKQFHVHFRRFKRLAEKIAPELPKLKSEKEQIKVDGTKWISSDFYTYNDNTDTYVTFLRCAPKPIVVNGDTHRAMQRAYSNWDGNEATINEICRNFSFPRPWFIEYKQRHGWTHDREPFTVEELQAKPVELLVEEALEQKRSVLYQRYEQEKWKETKEDAEKWRQLQHNNIIPLQYALEEWKPVKPIKLEKAVDGERFSLVVGASDWHIGLKAIEDNLVFGKTWDVETGRKVLEDYLQKIYRDVQRLRVFWERCYLFNLGDLPHGLKGRTEKGTPLIMDVTRKQQYDAVFSLQTLFIEGLYEMFGNVKEVGVGGNHEGAFDWYTIARALQERYRSVPGIEISASTKMVNYEKIGSTLFLLTHGKNPGGFRFKYAAPGSVARQAQMQQEILGIQQQIAAENPEVLREVKQIYTITGDNHFYFQHEKGFYEDLQLSSPVYGDDYADNNRYQNKPSQTCLLVSWESGVKAPLRYYL